MKKLMLWIALTGFAFTVTAQTMSPETVKGKSETKAKVSTKQTAKAGPVASAPERKSGNTEKRMNRQTKKNSSAEVKSKTRKSPVKPAPAVK
jgi:hypothetical protein